MALFMTLCQLQNLINVGNANLEAGSISLKDQNTIGLAKTGKDNVLTLEAEGTKMGTSIGQLKHKGKLEVKGNHRIGMLTTTAGSNVIAHGGTRKLLLMLV